MTQNEMVLDYLRRHGSITPLEALEKLGCMRLGARIYDLRNMGHRIVSEPEPIIGIDGLRKRVARYRLTGAGQTR